MSNYVFKGDYDNRKETVSVRLMLVHFKDENEVDLIYSPHLDLTGSGHSLDEAKQSFKIALEDLFDYTLKKKTLGKLLKKLGWVVKGTSRKPKKVTAPSIATVIQDNDYVSEIFDTYDVNTFHQDVFIPACA